MDDGGVIVLPEEIELEVDDVLVLLGAATQI